MKRLTIGLALVVTVSLLLAAVAGAVPPNFCDDRPDHPQCSTTTTTTTPSSEVQACTPELLTGMSGSGATRFECLWKPVEGADVGTVTVTPDGGTVSSLVVVVRDASPGDICVLKQEWDGQPGPSYTARFLLAYGDLPDYPDYSGKTYWTWEAGNWCYPQDLVEGMRPDPNGEPLHLQVNFRVKKGTTIDVVLSPAHDLTWTP